MSQSKSIRNYTNLLTSKRIGGVREATTQDWGKYSVSVSLLVLQNQVVVVVVKLCRSPCGLARVLRASLWTYSKAMFLETECYIDLTVERFEYNQELDQISVEHMHRYAFAAQFSSGLRVLDVGCGSGYGSVLMNNAAEYLGIDVSESTIQKCRQMFGSDTSNFEVADVCKPTEIKGSFDLIVCFELIEHIHEQEQLIERLGQLLQPDGMLISSTPEIEVYNSLAENRNEYHVRELTRDQYVALLSRAFPYSQVFGQYFTQCSFIVEDPAIDGAWSEQTSPLIRATSPKPLPTYLIAVSSFKPSAPVGERSLMKSSFSRNLGGELVTMMRHAKSLELALEHLLNKKNSH